MTTAIREVKQTTAEAVQPHLPDGQMFVRPTVLWGKPYVWAVDRKGLYHLHSWPVGVSVDV